MADLSLRHLRLVKGDVEVLRDVTFEVSHGECVVLLGPSGSGKTALLRAIAGFETLTSGHVVVAGRDLAGVPPRERNLAMVTQRHRLQPHLDVRRNLGFPLAARGVSRDEADRRVDAEARAFSLRKLLRRRPAELSGGETQAAALARTLVRPPDLILLDSPLTDIDPIGRTRAIRELVTAKDREGTTLLVATGDQRVAASIADRVVVLDRGAVRAIGTFRDLYRDPPDTTVAQVVGSPPMNLLPGRVRAAGPHLLVEVGDAELPAPAGDTPPPSEVTVGVRPEDLTPVPSGDSAGLTVVVDRAEHTGAHVHLHGTVDGHPFTVVGDASAAERDRLVVAPTRIHLFDRDGRAVARART